MTKKTKSGFTIIEVVLVLAIAGLIFLMVFIALPALQRSQRDTQRSNDISRMQAALNTYQSNNRGSVPSSASAWTTFITNYLKVNGDTFTDPDGTDYVVTVNDLSATTGKTKLGEVKGTTFEANAHNIIVSIQGTCNTDGTVKKATGKRKVAMSYKREGGGWICFDN